MTKAGAPISTGVALLPNRSSARQSPAGSSVYAADFAAQYPCVGIGLGQVAPNFGKPLDFGDNYFETPKDLRMGFKILNGVGYVPLKLDTSHPFSLPPTDFI